MTRTATQAEREVFAATAALEEYRKLILAGHFDDHPTMQAIQADGDQRAAEECAKVVEWLRGCSLSSAIPDDPAQIVADLADAIERGEHHAS